MESKSNKKKKEVGVFSKSLLTRKIYINFEKLGNNIYTMLENKIKHQLEGKCTIEGYIQNDSISLISYSSGVLKDYSVQFEVVFECLICCPVEGMNIKCVVKNITQAGIKAIIGNEEETPVIIYLARDHHYNNSYFSSLKEKEEIQVKVVGQRYELNDKCISVIGELSEKQVKKKTKLVIK
tara:strand:- start:338 stop:880 length:543 start_codon:yes stop_codon:yes gene_type:complete